MCPRPPPLLLKVLVPSLAAGAIIGKAGDDLALLQALSGAKVKISRTHDHYPGTTERICLIMGSIISITQVHDYVMEKIYEKPEQMSRASSDSKIIIERHKQVKILVPNSTAGMIIGKSGCYIKEIKEKSGAFVQISQKSKEINLLERCVTIAGDIEQNRIAVTMILGKIDEDPHSSSCPGISYIDILGPVASAYPTGSPYAMVSNNFGNTATSIMPSSHSGCSPCPDTLSSHFSTIINNTPATPIIQGSCSLNNEDPDYYDEKLELQPYQSLSSIETIRNILRLSGFSQSGIHSISTAIETICRYRLVNYSTSKSNTTGSRNNITLYDSFPLYGSHNNEENTSTNPLEFLIASYLKDSLSINNDFYYSGSSDTECITRNLMVSKEKMSCLTSMDAFLIKEITMKTITEIKVHSDESLHNESSITLQIMGLDLDNVLEAIGMIIYSPLDPRLSETDLTV